jgi:hypothetical protein
MCRGLYHYLHISSIHSARLTNGRVADAYNEKQGFDPFNQLHVHGCAVKCYVLVQSE